MNFESSFFVTTLRYHPCFKAKDIKSIITFEALNPSSISPSCDTSSDNVNFTGGNFEKEVDIRKNISLFVIQLQEKCLLPESVFSELISGMSQLHDDHIDLFKSKVVSFLKEKGVDDSLLRTVSNMAPSNAVKSTYHEMASSHLKSKYMVTLGLVEPVEYQLENLQRKSASFQYVPLLKNLKAFIENDEVLHYVLNKQCSDQNGIFRDIYDGSSFKSNKLFSYFPNIQIILY